MTFSLKEHSNSSKHWELVAVVLGVFYTFFSWDISKLLTSCFRWLESHSVICALIGFGRVH